MANKGSFVNWAELYATQPSLAATGLSSGDTCTVAGTPLTWTLEAGVYWWHSDESGDPSPGSPSSPFATTAARNAAAPFHDGFTAYVVGTPAATAWRLEGGATGSVDGDWTTEMAVVADDAAAEALLATAGNGSSCITLAGAIWTKGA